MSLRFRRRAAADLVPALGAAAWRLFSALAVVLLLVPTLSAGEKSLSLIFTDELLTQIATDNQGEQSDEIVKRIIGLSPAVINARLERAGGRVGLFLTVNADDLPVHFRFTLDKMTYYRLRTARADLAGAQEALREAVALEPQLREVALRHDGRYTIIDLTLDFTQALNDLRESLARREAEERAAAAMKAAAETRAAAEARTAEEAKVAAAKTAAEIRTAAAASAAAGKAAAPREEQPRPSAGAAAAPLPKVMTYLSAQDLGSAAAPVVDGQPTDAAWQSAKPYSFEVQGASGKMTVTAAALWTPVRVWILVRWPDRSRDDVHRPWIWSKENRVYVAGSEVEDAVAIGLAREGRIGECMLAGGESVSDLWTWRAGRTDPSGFAEDGTLTLSFKRLAGARSYQARNGRTVWIKEEPDAGSGPYRAQTVEAYAGDRIPGHVARTPSGSTADVAAKGAWKDGYWSVEFSRRLSTGDPSDAALAAGRESFVSVAIFDSRESVDHSTSKEFALKLEGQRGGGGEP